MQMYNMHITMLCMELIRKHTVRAHQKLCSMDTHCTILSPENVTNNSESKTYFKNQNNSEYEMSDSDVSF